MIEATGDEIIYTSMHDPSLAWITRGLNANIMPIVLGAAGDPDAPSPVLIDVAPGPGDRLRGMHHHPTDAVNLVIEGAMYMDGVWLRPGQAKVVPAHTAYGDALVGPDGVKFIEIFAGAKGAIPTFTDPEDQAYYEAVHGDSVRAATGLYGSH